MNLATALKRTSISESHFSYLDEIKLRLKRGYSSIAVGEPFEGMKVVVKWHIASI